MLARLGPRRVALALYENAFLLIACACLALLPFAPPQHGGPHDPLRAVIQIVLLPFFVLQVVFSLLLASLGLPTGSVALRVLTVLFGVLSLSPYAAIDVLHRRWRRRRESAKEHAVPSNSDYPRG